MKRKLQIASGVLSLILLIEVSSYVLTYPLHFLHGIISSLPATASLSGSQLTCVSTDPSNDITPVPPVVVTPPPTGLGTITIPVVASGCTMPNMVEKPTYYVDAINGDDTTGDGSQAKPWKSLQNVITKDISSNSYVSPYYNSDKSIANGPTTKPLNASAPIKPGSIIYLMNGNYGSIDISGYVNNDFIAIAAAPGQTPVIASMQIQGSAKWIFSGIKFQSIATAPTSFVVDLRTISTVGPPSDIIFDNNTVSSSDDVASWTQADWVTKGQARGIQNDSSGYVGGGCLTFSNNTIYNIKNGVLLGIDNTLFTGNTIDHFADDGLDYAANNLVISHNVVENNFDILDGNHNDAMQGQIGRFPKYSNITIDNNFVQRQTPSFMNNPWPQFLQGIDAFDNDWTNLTVTNNVVLTDTYWGMNFASVHNGLIAHNTVMNDGTPLPSGIINPHPQSGITMLGVYSTTQEGQPTTNTTVEDNITSELSVGATDPSVIVRNNIAKKVDIVTGGQITYHSLDGIYGTNNVVDHNLISYFNLFSSSTLMYNLQVKSGTPASGLGAPL